MKNTSKPAALSRTARIALAEVIQDMASQRMLANPEAHLTLHSAVLSVLGDAGHKQMTPLMTLRSEPTESWSALAALAVRS